MGIESFGNEEYKIPLEEWDNLKTESSILLDRIKNISSTSTSHFRHVANNKAAVIIPDIIDLRRDTNSTKGFNTILKHQKLLKKYLDLLDEFPEFREMELTTEKGMFPEIVDTGEEALVAIDRMEEKLRAK